MGMRLRDGCTVVAVQGCDKKSADPIVTFAVFVELSSGPARARPFTVVVLSLRSVELSRTLWGAEL